MNKQRNRHTGRINAAKARVLNDGRLQWLSSDGRKYYQSQRMSQFKCGQIVRDFSGDGLATMRAAQAGVVLRCNTVRFIHQCI